MICESFFCCVRDGRLGEMVMRWSSHCRSVCPCGAYPCVCLLVVILLLLFFFFDPPACVVLASPDMSVDDQLSPMMSLSIPAAAAAPSSDPVSSRVDTLPFCPFLCHFRLF
jgi:hypothetical protein